MQTCLASRTRWLPVYCNGNWFVVTDEIVPQVYGTVSSFCHCRWSLTLVPGPSVADRNENEEKKKQKQKRRGRGYHVGTEA